MRRDVLGIIYIFLGILVIVLAASEFILKAAIVVLGFYLIYRGLQLRNAQQILFFFQRFKNRF